MSDFIHTYIRKLDRTYHGETLAMDPAARRRRYSRSFGALQLFLARQRDGRCTHCGREHHLPEAGNNMRRRRPECPVCGGIVTPRRFVNSYEH